MANPEAEYPSQQILNDVVSMLQRIKGEPVGADPDKLAVKYTAKYPKLAKHCPSIFRKMIIDDRRVDFVILRKALECRQMYYGGTLDLSGVEKVFGQHLFDNYVGPQLPEREQKRLAEEKAKAEENGKADDKKKKVVNRLQARQFAHRGRKMNNKSVMPDKKKEKEPLSMAVLRKLPDNPRPVQKKPEVVPEKPKEAPKKPEVVPEKPEVVPEKPEVVPEKPKEAPKKPEVVPEKPKEVPEKPKEVPEKPKEVPEKPKEAPKKPEVVPEEVSEELPEPVADPVVEEDVPKPSKKPVAKPAVVSKPKNDSV